MMYLLVGWREDKVETWLWYLLFSQAVGEFSRLVNQYSYTKVSLYKVDLKFLTITLMGEE